MVNKPFILQDFKIVSLKKFEDEGKNGPYVKFIFSIDHSKAPKDEFEFHYFGEPTAPETWPYNGVAIKEMVGEVGQYQGKPQYNVKKIIYDNNPSRKKDPKADGKTKQDQESGSTTPPPNPAEFGKSLGTCVSYAKDLQIARLAYLPHDGIPSLLDLVDEVGRAGLVLYDNLMNKQGRTQ